MLNEFGGRDMIQEQDIRGDACHNRLDIAVMAAVANVPSRRLDELGLGEMATRK